MRREYTRSRRFTVPTSRRQDLDQLRCVRLGPFTVRTYDLHHTDRWGKSAVGYRVTVEGQVVAECYDIEGAVYVPGHQTLDGDATMASVVTLVCYSVQHDADNPVDPGWDADQLSDLGYMRWPDL